MPTSQQTPRAELVSLLRGYFACPVIAALADIGLIKRMRGGAFGPADLPAVNRPALLAALRYLQSVGLIEPAGPDTFRATPVGEYVLNRTGAFHLLRSYRDYFDRFAEMLSDPTAGLSVRRLENVGGTGQLHARKYFPWALRQLSNRDVQCLVDVGCGNGEFLAAALAEHPSAMVVAVDLSAEAVQATKERFRDSAWNGRVRTIVAEAAAVADWSRFIPDRGTGAVVTCWFVLHEFASGNAEPVVRFFRDLHGRCPQAEVIVGGLVALPPDALAPVRAESVMPELLLFHALSGQGVLSWEQHQTWLGQIPYRVSAVERFDEVLAAGDPVPSSVV